MTHLTTPACVHCAEPVDRGVLRSGALGDDWLHVRIDREGGVHTGKGRCQSDDVPYGHLAHPADVPCRADGPNPCLGASIQEHGRG